ncbi:MAG: nickel pincer cofactor biosynthesis protein LarC [Chloroflexi bacterium]|nr:MAG: nickel pincer cofactor biosynthesis protein LarC [Chloroflexota bacterium]
MPRIAYADCFSGASGDMLLGAMLGAGLPLAGLKAELNRIPLAGYEISSQPVKRAGLAAVLVTVRVEGTPAPRLFGDILRLIDQSSLPAGDKEKGAAVFRRLAEAEAAVHGESVDSVHLHDVGAVDAVVDIMGVVAGLRLLGVEQLYSSPLPLGGGETSGPHGVLPVPAPATLELLARAGAPVCAGGPAGELTTPTGAALLATLARFERPGMNLQRAGYGAGSRDPADRPNVLRLWLGEPMEDARPMLLIETNIDDMSAEMLAFAREKLLAEGAADAWLTPVQMKKGRPGVVLSLICRPEEEERFARLVLRETSTLGVRVRPVHRWEAEREVLEFQSSLGPAAVKVKRITGEPPRIAPEYEACRRLAETSGLPLAEVYRIVELEVRRSLTGPDTSAGAETSGG